MLRLRRHPARSLLVAPFVLVAAACGGSGSDAAEPVRTDAPVAAAPAGPAATVTPAEICALLTGDEVATAVTVDGFDPGAFTFAAPTVSDSGNACTINAAGAGVIDLLPSEFYGDQATLLMSYPAGQVVSDGVVFVPDSATVQGWVLLPSGAPVEVATSLSFEFTPTILAALAAALQS